mgnify:CR=1 FL=1
MNHLEIHNLNEANASNILKIYYLYICNDELNIILTESIILNKEYFLNKEVLINMINKHKIYDNNKYSLFSIMKYNIGINDNDMLDKDFDIDNYEPINYLSKETYMKNIYFDNMSYLFENINSLFIIFKRKTTNKQINFSRKINTHKRHNKTRKFS